MPYNLIREAWIPVRRKNGKEESIPPWKLTDQLEENPVEALNAPRPDFDGALIQFLIGLVQTACPPESDRDWRRGLTNPPGPEALREAFGQYEHVFNLDGEGPRFMQEYEPLESGKVKPISFLLPDSPTRNTLDENKDHFVKSREAARYSESTTAMALLTLQLNAPSGGPGHRTSVRGGGPVTTVILGQTLWETVWLNVVLQERLEALYGSPDHDGQQDIFPWLAPTRLSKGEGTATTPDDVHPLQMYWSMSRRIRLEPKTEQPGRCAITDRSVDALYTTYKTKAYGVNYEGPWQHPLTPHYEGSDGTPMPKLGRPGGFSYRHWRGFVLASDEDGLQPALVVRQFFAFAGRYGDLNEVLRQRPRLWVFGYDTLQMKVRSWHESIMPLYLLDPEHRASFESFAERLIQATDYVVGQLTRTLKRALYGNPSTTSTGRLTWDVRNGVSVDKTFFTNVDHAFWQDTQPRFYELLEEARHQIGQGGELGTLRLEWQGYLRGVALDRFDEVTQYSTFRVADPKAVALARRELSRRTSRQNSTMSKTLNLPETTHA